MKIKSRIIFMALSVVCRVDGSVAGITYRDDFDFEQRYRNVHECDPFYWHPLHLPEDCADMYERLIRSRIPSHLPKHSFIPKTLPTLQSYEPYYYSDPLYQYPDTPYYPTKVEIEPEVSRELTPYEEMLETVQKDIINLPSVPSVKTMPNFGPVAVYQQPVSKISADMITKVATAYAHASDKDAKEQDHLKKKDSKWKELVNKIRHRERQGWKRRKYGDIVSYSKT